MKTAVYAHVDYPVDCINVKILFNGVYAGVGRFCMTMDEVEEFAKSYGAETLEEA